jgi:hypothetical protein
MADGSYHIHPVVSLRRHGNIRRGDIVSYQVWVTLRDKRRRQEANEPWKRQPPARPLIDSHQKLRE